MSLSYRVHAIKVTTKREIRSTLYGVGLYVILALIFLVTSYSFVRTTLTNVTDAGILSLSNPIINSLFNTMGLAAIYLGLCSSLAISRDRDLGTLEVLFYGPVDAVSYVLGKFAHQLMAYGVVLVFALINFYGLSLVTNVGFSLDIVGIMVLSIFMVSCVVSFGIVLSVSTKRMIVSVVVFLVLTLFFWLFSTVHTWIMNLPLQNLPATLVYVRIILDNANEYFIKWVSPMAYFLRGRNAVLQQDLGGYLISLLSSTVYSAILLAVSVWVFQRKGVRR